MAILKNELSGADTVVKMKINRAFRRQIILEKDVKNIEFLLELHCDLWFLRKRFQLVLFQILFITLRGGSIECSFQKIDAAKALILNNIFSRAGGKGRGVSITNHERIFPQITNHVSILCNFTNYVFSYVMTENDSRKLLDLRCIFSDFSW